MPAYYIECIQQEADNDILGAKLYDNPTTDVDYFSGVRVTRSTGIGAPNVTDLHSPVYYEIDNNRARLWDGKGHVINFPIQDSNLTSAELKDLIDNCNCSCGGGGGTFVNNETGGNAPAEPTEPANPPAEAESGSVVIEVYDDSILYWTYDGTNWTLEYTHVFLSGSGNTATFADETGGDAPGSPVAPATPPGGVQNGDVHIEIFDDGPLFWTYSGGSWSLTGSFLRDKRVFPDGESVAFQTPGTDVSISRSAGSCTVTIPANVYSLKSFHLTIDADGGDLGGDSSYQVDFVYAGTRNFNQNADLSDAVEPNVFMRVFNTGTQLSTTTATAHEITRPAAGTIRVNFLNALQSAFDKRRIVFNFE